MKDSFGRRADEELYRGLDLNQEESEWVKHYLRVADRALFGERPAPRVLVVGDEWQLSTQRVSIARKKAA